MKGKYLAIFILGIFLISFVSAEVFTFDNRVDYIGETKLKVEIINTLDLFGDNLLGTIELKSHTSIDEIIKVNPGKYQPAVIYEFSGWELYKNGLGNVYFTDMKTGEEIDKLYYFATWEELVKEECTTTIEPDLINATKEVVTCKDVTYWDWEEYNSRDIPNTKLGNKTIALMVYIEPYEYTDAIWTIAGKRIKEHAEFEASNTRFTTLVAENLQGSLTTFYVGINISVGSDNLNLTNVGKIPGATEITAYVYFNNLTLFKQSNFTGDNASFTNVVLLAGEKYAILLGAGQSDFSSYRDDGLTFPIDMTEVSFIAGARIDGVVENARAWGIESLDLAVEIVRNLNVVINAPPNYDNLTTTFTETFNATVTDDFIVQNVSLIINGSIDQTNTSNHNGTYIFTKVFTNGFYNWSILAFDNDSSVNISTQRFITVNVPIPVVNLYAPIDWANFSNSNVTHTCDAYSMSYNILENISLMVDGAVNQTRANPANATNHTFYNVYDDGIYNWSCLAYSNISIANDYVNRTFTIESVNPVLNLTFPRGRINYHRLGQNLFLNWTLEESNFLNCSYVYNENLIYLNETWCKETNYTVFNYSYGVDSIVMYANDTFLNNVTNTSTFDILVLERVYDFETPVLKGTNQDYSVNFSTNGSAPSNANFYYDGSLIGTATITDYGSDLYSLDYSQIVSSTGTFNLFFSVDVLGISAINTTTQSQTVNPINFSLCDAGNPVAFINFTFEDESTGSALGAKADLIDVDYWLEVQSNSDSYIATRTASNSSYYAFCFDPGSSNIILNMSFKYSESDYPIRTFAFNEQTFTSATTNQTLYMLGSAEGIYSTIQVVDATGSPILDVQLTIERQINGVYVIVGLETTGGDGSATFWVNPNFKHRITAQASGYITQQVLVTLSQTTYTITMTSTTEITLPDYSQGISYYLNPGRDFLDNFTEYDFNMTLSSSFWTINEFGFSLYWGNGTLIGSDSDTSPGVIELTGVNSTSNQTSIYMEYYYLINVTYTNGTRTWFIQSTDLRDFSLFSFFTTLSLYINSGNMFGMGDFGRILLSIIILVMVTGSISLRYGVRNDIFIAGIIFGLVLFLDVGLGFFGRIQIGPNLAVENFVTIIVALILIAMIIMEERL